MRYFIVALFVLFGLAAEAQIPSDRPATEQSDPLTKLSITGQVIDAETGYPLESATVSIYEKSNDKLLGGSLTGPDGRFEAEFSGRQAYAVIEYIGYQYVKVDPIPGIQNTRSGGTIDLGTITISPSALDLEEVEIRAEKSETQFSLDKRVFNVGKDLANRGGSAVDVLDNVPSVTVDIEGQVSLRGSEGVRILIDGKRSGLGNNLKNIPSNQIDRIEVITNPSARYDAEGIAGIINIILKKDSRSGFNGSFDLNVGYPARAGIGANVNYRKNKINWFAGYGFNKSDRPGEGKQFTQIETESDLFITDQTRDYTRNSTSHTMRFGMDYFFNPKTTLTGSLRYQTSDDDNFSTNMYNDYLNTYPENPISQTIRTDDENEDESELEYSLNFRKEFSSREHALTIALNYDDELEKESSIFLEHIRPLNQMEEYLNQRSENDEAQKEWVAQADYVHPFGKDHKMEFGLKASFRDITNDFLVEEYQDDEWTNLEGLSNNFIYNENILAAYSQYGNKFNKFSFQLGLRVEYGDISTELLQTNEENQRDVTNLFPSIFLNYEFTEQNAMQMSYSRRIRRPHFWHLNPFFTYNDSRNFFVGNPNLDPEYTDSYEVNYLKFWDKATFNAGLFYRHSTGVIERIRTIDDQGKTTLQPENLSERDDYGLELSLNYTGLDWLRLDASGNFFRSITDGKNLGESFHNDSYTWTSKFTSRFTFWNGSDLQIRLNYRAPRETTQGEYKSTTTIDVGWSKDFLAKKNLTITLSARDLLNSRKYRYTQTGDGFSVTGEHQWRSRSINLAFNYRINQKKKRGRPQGNFEGGDF